MASKTRSDYVIEVGKTVGQAIDLLTRKRWYAALSTGQALSEEQEEELRGEGLLWIEILGAEEGDAAGCADWRSRRPRRRYLVVGGPLDSRHQMCGAGESADGANFGIPIAFPPVGALYEHCRGKALRFVIRAESEGEANRIWLQEMLRLGTDPGKWYRCDDSSSVTVSLRRIAKNAEGKPAGEGAASAEPAPVDIADFEVYDRLYGKLERMARDYCYGDDVFVEYSVSSDEGVSRYCATEFYSNHNWGADPANLFVMRFRGEVEPGECGPRDVRFSHPTKVTERRDGHERFLVDALVMSNDVKVKFYSGRGEDRRPNETVSADRILDNLVDYDMWVEMYRKEVQMD